MGDLIRAFSDEKVERREGAARQILSTWRKWTDADLTTLRKASDSNDAEVAAQAKESIAAIQLYRGIPETVWKAIPDVGPTLARGSAIQVAEFLSRLKTKWEKSELGSRETLCVLVPLVRDSRESEEASVSVTARMHIQDIVPCLTYGQRPEEIEGWWKENREKSELNWLIPGLDSKDERLRGAYICRLFAIGTEELRPKLFTALREIQEEYAFVHALDRLPVLPRETVMRELGPYLQDPRLEVRWVAARIMVPHDARIAVGSIIDALENPRTLKYGSLHQSSLYGVVHWLVHQKDDQIIPTLRRALAATPEHEVKEIIILGLGTLDDPRLDEAFAEALWDTDCTSGSESWGKIANPRICDQAGIFLSRRLKNEGTFHWPLNYDVRDKNLIDLWTIYRKRKGLPEAPFLPPGVSAADSPKVANLIQELLSDEEKRRQAALKDLSRLGMGAWPILRNQVAKGEASIRERLGAVLVGVQNCVTRVEGNEEAQSAVRYLREHLHEPLDIHAFFKRIVEPWFGDPEFSGFQFSFQRDTLGRGLTLGIEFVRTLPGEKPPDEISFMGTGGGSCCGFRKDALDGVWAVFMDQLDNEMRSLSPITFKARMEMRKCNSARRKKP